MKLIAKYLKPYYGRMFFGLLIKIFGTIAELFMPWILAHILDDIVPEAKLTGNTGAIFFWGGMMFVIPPFVETYYEADAEDPWEYIWVGFTGTPPLQLNDFYNIPGALRIFQHMKASHNLHNGKTEFILAQLWELFSFLLLD